MDGYLYYGSLTLIFFTALMFYKSNNTKLMLIALGIGVYIIYSHETGHTATEFKNVMIDKIDKAGTEYVDSFKTEIDKAGTIKK